MTSPLGDVALSSSYRYEAIERMAAVLARQNRLQALYVRHDLGQLLRLGRRVLPANHPVVAMLAQRSFSPPGTPVARTVSWSAILARGLRRVSYVGVDRASLRLDEAVARRLRARPPRIFIGMAYTSLESLAAARRVGARSFLYVNSLPWARNDALTQEAESLTAEAMRREALAARFSSAKIHRFEEELSQADGVFAESAVARRTLISHGVDPEKIVLLPTGIDVARFRAAPRDDRPRRLRVLFVGRVMYLKGLRFLSDASILARDAVESLTVVGDTRGGVSALCATMPHVRFVGQTPSSGLAPYYADADVLVVPSLVESMARVVFEGMASGLPVIITPQCGYEGIVEDGMEGFVVPPRHPPAIAERLCQLSADGGLRLRMGRAARAVAEANAWPRFEAGFLGVLRGN